MWSRTGRTAAALFLFVTATVVAAPASAGPARPSSGLSVADAGVVEGDADSSVAVTVRISSPPKKAVTFGWRTDDGSAVAGADYVAASGTGTIAKGATATTVVVGLRGDTAVEPDETFEVLLTSVSGTGVVDGVGVVTIANDDAPPPPDPFGWSPPAGSVPASGTVVYLESQPGDWVGQGRTYRYTKADSVIAVTSANGRRTVSVDGDEWWNGTFDATTTWWSGEGRGCGGTTRHLVDQESFVDGALASLTLRFEQRCDGSRGSLFGFVRYDATDTTAPPPPTDPSTFPWSPKPENVPATGDYLYFESVPGDWVGAGQTRLYTTIAVTESSGVVRVAFDGTNEWWDGAFSGPDAQTQLLVGHYAGLQRYPFHNPAKGGLSFSGSGRGCNELTGAFAADEITYAGGVLQSVTIRFVQYCDGSTAPLRGAFRWSAG